MTQTRFIIGFAFASLAFLAGVYAVGFILEVGGFHSTGLWLGLACMVALFCAWFTLKVATGHRPNILAYMIGAGLWLGLVLVGPVYVHDNFTAVNFSRTLNMVAGIAFFGALAAWIVVMLPYRRFRNSLFGVNIGMLLIIAGSITIVGSDVHAIYNPETPERQVDLDGVPAVIQEDIAFTKIAEIPGGMQTPCSRNRSYAPILHLTHGDDAAPLELRAEFLEADFDLKGLVEVALRDSNGRWICQVSFGEPLALLSGAEAAHPPVSLFVGLGIPDRGFMRLTMCTAGHGCDVNIGVSQ
ncbi:MAG: hypothetical protein ACPGUX_03050 [Halocynthiibacter sp.]